MRCPRVLLLQKYWISPKGTGGSERIADRVSRALAKNNVPTAVLTCGEFVRGREIPDDFCSSKLVFGGKSRPVHEIPSIPQLTEYVCRHCDQADIIQIGWGYEHYPDEMKKILKLPLPKIFVMLETGHFDQMTQNFETPKEKKEYIDLLRQSLNVVVAISETLKDEALNLGFSNVELIYGPVSDHFRPVSFKEKSGIRKEVKLPAGKIVYLFAGRLVPEKGVDHLIESWKLLDSKVRDNSALVLVGGFSSEDETLLNKVTQLQSNYPDSVYWLGSINDEAFLGKIFSAADVFIYPTRHQEGLALAPAEAMSSGLPLVTTKYATLCTGMSDLAIPGKTCLVYSMKGGAKDLAKELTKFQSFQLRIEYGNQAINRIRELEMSSDAIAKKYIELYQQLLNQNACDPSLAK